MQHCQCHSKICTCHFFLTCRIILFYLLFVNLVLASVDIDIYIENMTSFVLFTVIMCKNDDLLIYKKILLRDLSVKSSCPLLVIGFSGCVFFFFLINFNFSYTHSTIPAFHFAHITTLLPLEILLCLWKFLNKEEMEE